MTYIFSRKKAITQGGFALCAWVASWPWPGWRDGLGLGSHCHLRKNAITQDGWPCFVFHALMTEQKPPRGAAALALTTLQLTGLSHVCPMRTAEKKQKKDQKEEAERHQALQQDLDETRAALYTWQVRGWVLSRAVLGRVVQDETRLVLYAWHVVSGTWV